jgi:hypothetical protein
MLTIAITGYCLIAVLMATWIAADRKSWLTRLPGAGFGSPEIDFLLAFLWGLVWPITLLVWISKPASGSDDTKKHED